MASRIRGKKLYALVINEQIKGGALDTLNRFLYTVSHVIGEFAGSIYNASKFDPLENFTTEGLFGTQSWPER